jgi:hypothetical protein
MASSSRIRVTVAEVGERHRVDRIDGVSASGADGSMVQEMSLDLEDVARCLSMQPIRDWSRDVRRGGASGARVGGKRPRIGMP